MRNFEKVRSQNEYLKNQLALSMRNQRNLQGTSSFIPSDSTQEDEEEESNPSTSLSEEDMGGQ